MELLRLALVLAPLQAGCSPATDPPPGPQVVAPVERPAAVHPIEVTLTPCRAADAWSWYTETCALATGWVDLGLQELQGVVVVGPRGASAGVREVVGAPERWRAEVALSGTPAESTLGLTLCRDDAACTTIEAVAPRDAAYGAVPRLLERAGAVLDRAPHPGVEPLRGRPPSEDLYAVRIAGRAAATWYGIVPPRGRPGDRRTDPIARAIYLDPAMVLAQWIAARRAEEAGTLGAASDALQLARRTHPFHPLLAADEAALLARQGQPARARRAYDALLAADPGDPRFVLPRARAVLAAGDAAAARKLAEELAVDWPNSLDVAVLRVEAAAAAGVGGRQLDGLLARWQALDLEDAEPVRRRISGDIAEGLLEDAWAHLPELARRGATAEANRLAVPLGIATDRLEEAAQAADRDGATHTAHRLRLRAAAEADPPQLDLLEGDPGPEAQLALASAHLLAGDAERALRAARRARALRPHYPDPARAEASALRALGRSEEAVRVEREATRLEPAAPALLR